MTFGQWLALAIAGLAVVPWLAHRLRRRRADERPFAPTHLVPPAPPQARRRARLEDRALFAVRAIAVAALAVLGASPFVRCTRLSLQRSGGASVALAVVVDDSLSMRVRRGGPSRFERAKDGARELLASAREGDAVAVVLAGSPARVGLAATTDLGAARAAIESLAPSDRATDLDGAIGMARALVDQLPQVDKRVVVLSDLEDGRSDAAPLGEGLGMPMWIALPELGGPAKDCAVVRADRLADRVRARVVCSEAGAASGREVVVAVASASGDKVVGRVPATSGEAFDVSTAIPLDAPAELVARLSGTDDVAADDAAPVLSLGGPGAVAVVADAADETAVTGGPPIVEQALAALRLDVETRPVPSLPDREGDLAAFLGVLVDDPPGLTPEQRRALGAFIDAGGDVLIALGPRAAAAPLGATLEPVLAHAVTWGTSPVSGAAPPGGTTALLSDAAASLGDLSARGRAQIAAEDAASFETLVAWKDGAPLVARRTIGAGHAWIVTLPFAVDASDLTLRPAFLAVLDAWVGEARANASARRTEVGAAWTFGGGRAVSVEGPLDAKGHGPALAVARGEAAPNGGPIAARAVPPVAGAYRVTIDGRTEIRAASVPERELDFRSRRAAEGAVRGEAIGDRRAKIDASPGVALVLLVLLAAELALRLRARERIAAA